MKNLKPSLKSDFSSTSIDKFKKFITENFPVKIKNIITHL